MRTCHLWELICELPFHCLARSCHLEVLMVISIDTLLIKQLRKLLNVILVISNSWWQDVWRDNSILEDMSSWHLYRYTFDWYHNRNVTSNKTKWKLIYCEGFFWFFANFVVVEEVENQTQHHSIGRKIVWGIVYHICALNGCVASHINKLMILWRPIFTPGIYCLNTETHMCIAE